MNWLMPIEATSPQPNAKANSNIDLVRMNLSRTSGRGAASKLTDGRSHAVKVRATESARFIVSSGRLASAGVNFTKSRVKSDPRRGLSSGAAADSISFALQRFSSANAPTPGAVASLRSSDSLGPLRTGGAVHAVLAPADCIELGCSVTATCPRRQSRRSCRWRSEFRRAGAASSSCARRRSWPVVRDRES